MQRLIFLLLGFLWFAQAGAQGIPEFREADSLFKYKDYDGAIELFTQAIKNGSKYTTVAYYKRSRCFFRLKDYTKAEMDARTVLARSPKKPEFDGVKAGAYWTLAGIYSVQGHKEKSFEAYLMALKFEESAELYSTLGFMAIELEKYNRALKYINKAVEMDSTYAYGYSNRAWAYVKLGKLDKAKEDIEISIRLDPTNPYAFKHRALIYLAEGKTALACEDLHKARELGYAYFGDEPDAAEVYQLLQKNCP